MDAGHLSVTATFFSSRERSMHSLLFNLTATASWESLADGVKGPETCTVSRIWSVFLFGFCFIFYIAWLCYVFPCFTKHFFKEENFQSQGQNRCHVTLLSHHNGRCGKIVYWSDWRNSRYSCDQHAVFSCHAFLFDRKWRSSSKRYFRSWCVTLQVEVTLMLWKSCASRWPLTFRKFYYSTHIFYVKRSSLNM